MATPNSGHYGSCSSGHCDPQQQEKRPMPQRPYGRQEAASERGARYMWLIEECRTAMQDDIRAMRQPSDGIRSRASCDRIIDAAVYHVAQETLKTGTDYDVADTQKLVAAVKENIKAQLASRPDKGYALGE